MKILIIINDVLIARNFISTSSFKQLEKKQNVFFAINNDCKKIVGKKRGFFYKFDNSKYIKLASLITTIFMMMNMKKSISYRFRFKRMIGFHFLYNKKIFFVSRLFNFIIHLFRKRSLWYLSLPFINVINIKNWIIHFLIKKIPIPKDIKKFFLKNKKFDAIILPSSGIDPMAIKLDKIAKIVTAKKIVIINNWDNISSKGFFWYKPDLLGVWGSQMFQHAQQIQSIPKKNISIVGAPQYQKYFNLREKKIKSPFKFKYFLFVGPALPFDELKVLEQLDFILENNKNFKGFKIVYRPHPHQHPRECNNNFFNFNFKNIILDPQAKNYYQKKKTFYPNLKYYPSLLKNAKLVLAPLSTMLLESIIFRKKILVIAHSDNYHYTTPKRNLENLEHLKIINRNPLLHYSYDLLDLEKKLVQIFKDNRNKEKKMDKFREKILINSADFQKNILFSVNKLFKNE